jgi:hypothetical protein
MGNLAHGADWHSGIVWFAYGFDERLTSTTCSLT